MALKLFKKGEKAEKPEKVPKAPKEPKEKSPKRSLFKRAPKEPKQEESKPDPPKLVEEVSFTNLVPRHRPLRSMLSEKPPYCLVYRGRRIRFPLMCSRKK